MAEVQLRLEAAPVTPGEVSVFVEDGHFVFKADDARAIYYFDKDKPGRSNCDRTCAATWRPVLAPADASAVGDWTAILRKDGPKQWAYKRRPVYTFVQDEPGRTKGDGIQGLWHVLKP
jgi:predicted lipoprotein with Yx(FWY)xxD motif